MTREVDVAHARLTGAFSLEAVPPVKQRVARLRALGQAMAEGREDLVSAVNRDFSPRAEVETLTAELGFLQGALKHTIKKLPKWAKASRERVLSPVPGVAEVWPEPKGVVGILSPWNYPLQLALMPLILAIAAGNKVLLKPSERSPHSAEALVNLIQRVFPGDEAIVLTGGVEVAQAVSELPLGHLFFTGSTETGRKVAMAAAKTLTPVTLELGGRSPAVALPGADPQVHGRMIAWGRWLNAGQTCVAPNHLWVPKGSEAAWIDALLQHAQAFLPRDFTGMIDDRAVARATGLLEEARSRAVDVRQIEADIPVPPAVVLNPPPDLALMREEIFAPILPVLTYDTLDDVLKAETGTTPLASYVFGDGVEARAALSRLRSGGGAVNAAILHLASHDLPFGGIGTSGHGAYHGHRGFREFSHERSVFVASQGPWLRLLSPPYSNTARRIFRRMAG
ncbi:aldehyde dehydrogenase family protein [Palleronia abyssalis]|uniref:Aldehyde dehydrogenase n=1 Tax=Palleronia abyssalis TaxID=1501240 RepID=A0A2R8BYN9_9RHOB|nr:aldehyde dehydrogenase family protein [Palleronia abyssalis]SPJ25298.1 Aldehyde dehydrogenase [Palleronia abyssalis]